MAMLEPRPWQQPRAKTRLVQTVNAVDELARVRAEKAGLEKEEETLIALVRGMGAGEHRGVKVIAEVSSYQKETLDTKGLRAELPEAMIAKHTAQPRSPPSGSNRSRNFFGRIHSQLDRIFYAK